MDRIGTKCGKEEEKVGRNEKWNLLIWGISSEKKSAYRYRSKDREIIKEKADKLWQEQRKAVQKNYIKALQTWTFCCFAFHYCWETHQEATKKGIQWNHICRKTQKYNQIWTSDSHSQLFGK